MRIPDFLQVIDGSNEDSAALGDQGRVAELFLVSEDGTTEPVSGERPRRKRRARSPSWVRAPRPSDPPPLRAC